MAASSSAAASIHHVPGMGYAKHMPTLANNGLESVACRTRCGDVELKITLTAKFLAKPLKEALVEPFLKAYNKRATPPPNPPVEWMDIGCIKIDGVALDALDDAVLASGVFANKEAKVLLLPLSSLPSSRPLLESLLEVAGDAEPREPKLTPALIRVAQQAATDADEGAIDEDVSRRSSSAFEAISGGEADAAISGAAVRAALLHDDGVRALCFPDASPHVAALESALRRMATNAREPTVQLLRDFTPFFAALSAVACAPAALAKEEVDESTQTRAQRLGATKGSILESLLDDDRVEARRLR